MTEGVRGSRDRRRDDGMGVHLKRIYTRIDDLDVRLKKIERIVWTLGAGSERRHSGLVRAFVFAPSIGVK